MHKSIKTEQEQQDYFNKVHSLYMQAVQSVKEYRFDFMVAGFKVRICFAGNRMVDIMTPALNHLAASYSDPPDLCLCVWDSESTGIAMVPHPVGIEDFTDRGDIWGFYSERFKTAFHWSDFSINVLDLQQGIGVYWVESCSKFPYWVYSSPLRTLFHWWMESQGLQLIHAAAVGTENGAVLIPGKGGRGKSTTALACLSHGMYYLSDDYVIVRGGSSPMVYSLYNTAKINACDIERFPQLETLCINPEKLSHQKAVMYLYPHYKSIIRAELELKAIMLPLVMSSEDSFLDKVEFWTLQRAMGFTTMCQLPNVGRHTHQYLTGLIKQLPCFTLKAGSNLQKLPVLLTDYLHSPESFSAIDKTTRDVETTSLPLVSVVIPVYNGEKFIRDAVENLLNQAYPALEILIINDGSTDNTDGVVKQMEDELGLDLRYFWYGNDGPAYARNRGIRDASGDFIAFLDADDLFPEGNLKYLLQQLLENPEINVVRGYGQMMQLQENGTYEAYGDPRESYPAYIGAALYRKEVFRKVGLFDASMKFAEDSDWYMRATELGINMKWLDKTTLLVRRHGNNMTEGKNLIELNTLLVFKKALDRMRRGEASY